VLGFHENQIVIGEFKSIKITIMSLLSENVIPGNHGKVFGTNAKEPQTLEKIKSTLELIDGVKDVIIHLDVYPRELTVHTSKIVSVKEIEDAVKAIGFHAIPKHDFPI